MQQNNTEENKDKFRKTLTKQFLQTQ